MTNNICRNIYATPSLLESASFTSALEEPGSSPRLVPLSVLSDSGRRETETVKIPKVFQENLRITRREQDSSSSNDFNYFWNFDWWQGASLGQRAAGLGVAAIAALPTATAVGVALVSSVFGAGCGGTHEPNMDSGVTSPPPAPSPIPPRPNRAPTLNPIGPRQVYVGQTLVIRPTGSDPDADFIQFRTNGIPPGATFDNYVFQWTPTFPQRMTIGFYAIDEHGATSPIEGVQITVLRDPATPNRPPLFNPILDRTVRVDEWLQFAVLASDSDGDPISYRTTGLPAGARFSGSNFSWTPNSTQVGTYRVTFIAQDSGGLEASQVVQINVVPSAPRDNDGDGFVAGADCDDTRADVRPLSGNDEITRETSICPGTYGRLTVRGRGFTVQSYSGAVTLGFLYFVDSGNVTINNIRVIGEGARFNSFDFYRLIAFNNSQSIYLNNMFVQQTGADFGITLGSRIFISRSRIIGGLAGITLQESSEGNVISDCEMSGQTGRTSTGGVQCYINQSSSPTNIFRNNICRP